MPCDGPIAVSATLDPNKVSGDSNFTNNSIAGSFTPTMPTVGQEFFNTRQLVATHNATVSWSGGSLNSLTLSLGMPTTESFQSLVLSNPPSFFNVYSSAPFAYPIATRTISKPSGTSFSVSHTFTVQSSASRTNRSILDGVSWASLTGISSAIKLYTQPEKFIESNDSTITAFVSSALPTNYKTALTPAQAARQLYLAVARLITNQKTGTLSAVAALKTKTADSAGMTALYVACLRNIGIPARLVSGWTTGATGANWSEMYLPNIGWIAQDVALCNGISRYGNYAYYFGVMPDLNTRCAVQRGTTFTVNNLTFYAVQGIAYYATASGNPTVATTDTFSLK